jgi:hypothetical protein
LALSPLLLSRPLILSLQTLTPGGSASGLRNHQSSGWD